MTILNKGHPGIQGGLNSTHATSPSTFRRWRFHTRSPCFSGEREVIHTHSDTPTQTHTQRPPSPRSSLPALTRSPVNFPHQCGCGGRGSSVRLQPRRCAHTRIRSGSELRDVRREGAAAVVPGPVPGLPGCVHHQHDHVLQGRPGFLRPHPQAQTRSNVSRTERSRLTLRKFCKTVNFPALQAAYSMNSRGEAETGAFVSSFMVCCYSATMTGNKP